jgi:hypothetical protein
MHIHRWGLPQQQHCLHAPVIFHDAGVPVCLQHMRAMVCLRSVTPVDDAY